MTNLLRPLLGLFLILTSVCASAQAQQGPNYGNNKEVGAYKNINGINLYYEIYGKGQPLILLHGNGGSIKGHGRRIDYFKNHFQVIAIDSRGHGKSLYPDNKPLTYEQMAEDINTLMDSLKINNAFLWGQSDGGILGLLLAINHPDKIAKLAGFGVNIHPENAIFEELGKMVMDSLKMTKSEKTKQLYSLLAYQPHITVAELAKIKCPVLLMSGDRDAITLEHTIKIFESIENANLFVMPGASHFGSYQKPDLFNQVLLDFLTKPFSTLSTVDIMTKGKY